MLANTSHTHTRLTALCPGLPGWASTRKVKPIWILLKQETVSSSGISWTICKSAPSSRQTTTPAPHRSVILQAGCPSCHPTNSIKALKAKRQVLANWWWFKPRLYFALVLITTSTSCASHQLGHKLLWTDMCYGRECWCKGATAARTVGSRAVLLEESSYWWCTTAHPHHWHAIVCALSPWRVCLLHMIIALSTVADVSCAL